MRVVQALYWLKDMLPPDRKRILRRLGNVLADPTYGVAIHQDLIDGMSMMPAWMQSLVREIQGFTQGTAFAWSWPPSDGGCGR